MELTEAPQVTEEVPYFIPAVTAITEAGNFPFGASCFRGVCVGQNVFAPATTVATITVIGTKATTYPCTTSTTWTVPDCLSLCVAAPTVTITEPAATKAGAKATTRAGVKTSVKSSAKASITIPPGSKINLVRIAANGTLTVIHELGDDTGIQTAGTNTGDVDTSGYYWLSAGGRKWWRIGLIPGSNSYGQVIQQGTAAPGARGLGMHPLGRELSLIDRGPVRCCGRGRCHVSSLEIRHGPKVWTTVRTYTGTPRSIWGAVYGINTGVLYVSDNSGGEIWDFPTM
ncbi:hypothetical protein B0H63DRAFT_523117 [Podospora didyma]|uniref:Uncharacterized protein n=1 Tax=Podospora didyma TaxID=330526 RepID=A0AAE0NQG3_9PEZI|nr:hypothetical protein B0H63DRAFT_523117 [Podospora didyma]